MTIAKKQIHNIQHLIMEIVEKAGSGHPGAAISLTPLFFILHKYLRYDPDDPLWADRDILIMSNGHACLVQYIFLHLSSYLTLDDLINYRKIGSKTPGHPENSTDGIEVCTGPLGQGISNAVGFTFSQRKLKAMFDESRTEQNNDDKRKENDNGKDTASNNKFDSILKQITICIFGDGCYQEGISQESFSLACHYGSSGIFIYDCNGTTIDGPTSLSMSDCPIKRFTALGFDVIEVDGDNIEELDNVLKQKIDDLRHGKNKSITMIILRTKISSGTSMEGNEKSHGAALGRKVIDEFREVNGIQTADMYILDETYKMYEKLNDLKRKERQKWNNEMEEYVKNHGHTNLLAKRMVKPTTQNYIIDIASINSIFSRYQKEDKKIATRKHFQNALEEIFHLLPFAFIGSADLTPSCLTKCKNSVEFTRDNPKGNHIRYGIREHGMFGVMNGIASHGFFLPFGSTFLNFITYGFHGVRLACLSKFQTIYVMTHDSIGLGEDGPTHQPVETLCLLRSTPNLVTLRPCDGVETRFALKYALTRQSPTVICLSRQNLPSIKETSYKSCETGAYCVYSKGQDITIFATGSEVSIAIEVAKKLGNASVISLLSFELFKEQSHEYRKELSKGFKVSIEAGSTLSWYKYADLCIGLDSFGLSGETGSVYEHFGFGVDTITKSISDEYTKIK